MNNAPQAAPAVSLLAASCPVPLLSHCEIVLAHGSGGKLTHQLIDSVIRPAFDNPLLDPLHDGAVFAVGGERVVDMLAGEQLPRIY
jgi:hydrogenase expression/formation protein HypE